jgi:hypothetical protein
VSTRSLHAAAFCRNSERFARRISIPCRDRASLLSLLYNNVSCVFSGDHLDRSESKFGEIDSGE